MRRIVEENYGADADNNRGTTLISYELDSDDTDTVVDYLIDLYEEEGSLNPLESVAVYNPYTEEMDFFIVRTWDYLDKKDYE